MIDFAHPLALLLLPLAVLPLLPRQRDTLSFAWIGWLPGDRVGRIAGFLWRVFAVLAFLALVFALAGPGSPPTEVPRTGRGAEIVVLIDRSRSMDERMLPLDWRTIDPLNRRYQAQSRGEKKGEVARQLLSKFVAERRDDRFSLMFFSTQPIHIVPFTQHDEAVQAAITAGGIGRGLSDTNAGRALLAAIEEFDGRPYSGSRIILLVSDGAARLDNDTQRRIAEGVQRNRISVNWIYLRSVNSPRLDDPNPGLMVAEIALHRFFQSLRTPYRAYEADDPQDLARAVADVGAQQNYPLDFMERIPRRDFSRHALAVAAACCLLMLLYRAFSLRSWR